MKRLISVAAAAALIAPAGALAQTTGSSSAVTIGYVRAGTYFNGAVTSSQAVCAKHRTVTVYRNAAGADPAIGSDTTGAGGSWRLNLGGSPRPGYYYAKAKSRIAGPVGQRVLCRAAKSAVTRAS